MDLLLQRNSYVILFCLTILLYLTQGNSSSTLETNLSTTDNSSCARILLTESGGNLHEDAQYCDFPKLWSVEKKQCLFFDEVDCGNRTEPVTPCEYPKSNCSRPEGRNVSICVCQDHTDEQLNYETCLNMSNGSYVWPARKWSPYYIKCLSRRTILTNCSESQMFNFIVGHCDTKTDFVNQAFNLSLSSDIPETFRYLITQRSTSDVTHQQTKISGKTLTPTFTGPSDHPMSSTTFSSSLNVVKQSAIPFSTDSKANDVISSTKPSRHFSDTMKSGLKSTIDASSDVFQSSQTLYSVEEISTTPYSFESFDIHKVRKYVHSDGNSVVPKKSIVPRGLGMQFVTKIESSQHLGAFQKLQPSFSNTATDSFDVYDFLTSSTLSPTKSDTLFSSSTKASLEWMASSLTLNKLSSLSVNLPTGLYTHSETSIDGNVVSKQYKIIPTPSKFSISSSYSSSNESYTSSVSIIANSQPLIYSSNLHSISSSNEFDSSSNLNTVEGNQTFSEMSRSVHKIPLYSASNVVYKSLPSLSSSQPRISLTLQSVTDKITTLITRDTLSLPIVSLLITNVDTFVDSPQSSEVMMSSVSFFTFKTPSSILSSSSTSLSPPDPLPSSSSSSSSSLSSSPSMFPSKLSTTDLKRNTVMHVTTFSYASSTSDLPSTSSVEISSTDYLRESLSTDISSVNSTIISSSSYSVLTRDSYTVVPPTDRSLSINEITPSLELISTDPLTNLLMVTPDKVSKSFSLFSASSSNLEATVRTETSSSFVHTKPNLFSLPSKQLIEQSSLSSSPLVPPSLNSRFALSSSMPASNSTKTVPRDTPVLSSIFDSILSSSFSSLAPLLSIQATYTSISSWSLTPIISLSLPSSSQTAILSPRLSSSEILSSSTTQMVISTSSLPTSSIISSSNLLPRPTISSLIVSSVQIPTLLPLSSTQIAINNSLSVLSSSSLPSSLSSIQTLTSLTSSFSLEATLFPVSALTTLLSSSPKFISSSLPRSSLLSPTFTQYLSSSTNFASQLSSLMSPLSISSPPISTSSSPLQSSQIFISSSSLIVTPSLSSIMLIPALASSIILTSSSSISFLPLSEMSTPSTSPTPLFSSSMLTTSSSLEVIVSSSSSFVELPSSSLLQPSTDATALPSSSPTPSTSMLSHLFPSHTDITTHPSVANSKTYSINPSRTVSSMPSTIQSQMSTHSISYSSAILSSSYSIGEISDMKSASNTSLIVGLSVGITVAIICIIVITIIVMRNRTKGAGSNGVRLPPELYISENL